MSGSGAFWTNPQKGAGAAIASYRSPGKEKGKALESGCPLLHGGGRQGTSRAGCDSAKDDLGRLRGVHVVGVHAEVVLRSR